jgi:hypothetical protein
MPLMHLFELGKFLKQKPLGIVCWLFSCLSLCYGQGTFHVTFDGPPPQAPGTVFSVQQYQESGLLFTSLGFSFGRAGGEVSALPENGTAYLQAALTQSLQFMFLNGSPFDLVSVDLAEYSTVVPNAATVQFVGYRLDGSTVTTSFTTDGNIDGTGPLNDFETFFFGPEFSSLIRVEIPSAGWSLDNLFVTPIPEPSTCALLFIAGLMLCARRFSKL